MNANVFTTIADFAIWYNQTAIGKQYPIRSDSVGEYFDFLVKERDKNYAHAEDCTCELCREKRDRRNQRTL